MITSPYEFGHIEGIENLLGGASTPRGEVGHGLTVLVVDDDADIRNLVSFKLRLAGYQTQTADTGTGALDAIRRERPDAIVLDIGLPGMSGLDVCFRLRTEFPTANLPILMLTARSTPADVTMGLAVGAKDYMVKPFNTGELVRRVTAMLDDAVD